MPRLDLWDSVLWKLFRSVASGVFSMNPTPKVGVGMRKMTLFVPELRREIGLRKSAAGGCIAPPLDAEERLHRSCGQSVATEAGLALSARSRG